MKDFALFLGTCGFCSSIFGWVIVFEYGMGDLPVTLWVLGVALGLVSLSISIISNH